MPTEICEMLTASKLRLKHTSVVKLRIHQTQTNLKLVVKKKTSEFHERFGSITEVIMEYHAQHPPLKPPL